jgi:predicted molibdopterin-dependent oxidoreductase YjgC
MFRRLPEAEDGERIAITFDGTPVVARRGDTIAAALLAAGVLVNRETPVHGSPRAPWCMMGVCFDCLVTVDGTGSRQACMVRVAEGMRIESQRGRREAAR